MPGRAREKSSTGIYHVVLRGINRQIIFEDDEDYQKLRASLQEYRESSREGKDDKVVSGIKLIPAYPGAGRQLVNLLSIQVVLRGL